MYSEQREMGCGVDNMRVRLCVVDCGYTPNKPYTIIHIGSCWHIGSSTYRALEIMENALLISLRVLHSKKITVT